MEFKNRLAEYSVFTQEDVRRIFPNFQRIQLHRWNKKQYIEKFGKKWYAFTPAPKTDFFRFSLSNHFVSHSYISLYSAFSYYNFIPEAVFQTTAVSSHKTQSIETLLGVFSYKKISPKLFWGYELQNGAKIATPEKALLDFLYLYPEYTDEDDFEGLRLNVFEIEEKINKEKFLQYAQKFQNKAFQKRVQKFLHYLCSHSTAF